MLFLRTRPLQDVVKIRMQLQGELGAKRVYSSSLGAFPHIVREEGLFALWKGEVLGLDSIACPSIPLSVVLQVCSLPCSARQPMAPCASACMNL